MYFDSSYFIFVVPALLIALWAQGLVSSRFKKYEKIRGKRGYTGADAARMILDTNGLYHVRIERVAGNLSDHFDPKDNVIRLSDSVFGSDSVAAVGVAAHEAGHAVQHATGYVPIKVRSAIIPVTNIGSQMAIPLILLGFFFEIAPLILTGIIFYSLAAVFQLVTLPVEFNASARAMRVLEQSEILYGDELTGAKKVLGAAAMTYVAALITALAQVLRLLYLFGGRRRRD